MRDLFRGALVRLTSESAEDLARANTTWMRDSEFHRLADTQPMRLWSEKRQRESAEKGIERGPDDSYFRFGIRTLADDRLIGEIMLRVDWPRADGILGIAIGDREYWGKGFGTDATDALLRFAFHELNLRRVTLGTDSYNKRALRSYEKSGFRIEGTTRGEMRRERTRVNSIWMGILREEWQARQEGAK
jgi:RimJ/RimL family protein N-acetyltransferase